MLMVVLLVVKWKIRSHELLHFGLSAVYERLPFGNKEGGGDGGGGTETTCECSHMALSLWSHSVRAGRLIRLHSLSLMKKKGVIFVFFHQSQASSAVQRRRMSLKQSILAGWSMSELHTWTSRLKSTAELQTERTVKVFFCKERKKEKTVLQVCFFSSLLWFLLSQPRTFLQVKYS